MKIWRIEEGRTLDEEEDGEEGEMEVLRGREASGVVDRRDLLGWAGKGRRVSRRRSEPSTCDEIGPVIAGNSWRS